jgi:H+/gluconate symporter-like permease
MTNLGTSSVAGGFGAVVATITSYVLIFIWLEYRARHFQKLGYGFQDDKMTFKLDPEDIAQDDPNEVLPNVGLCFIPIVVILATFNIPMFGGKTLPVETAVILGVILSIIFFWKRIAGGVDGWLKVLNEGAANSGVAIINTSIVVGFGGVVKNTQGFADLVAGLKGLNMNPLIFVMITVSLCAAACGSASGGLGVAFSALKDTYIAMGINLSHVHRIASISAGTLDSLPHQGAQITLMGICKTTHKEAYFDIFITQIAIPFVSCFVFIALAAVGLAG